MAPMDGDTSSEASELTSEKSVEAAAKGGSDIDFEKLFNEQKEVTEKLGKDFESVRGEASQSKETIEKLKKALVPDVETVDDVAKELARIDADEAELYAAALEAERRGKPISLTVKNGLRTLALEKRYLTEMKAMKEENADLKKKASQAADPINAQHSLAYSNIDTLIESNLEHIYPDEDVRDAQKASITKLIVKELTDRRDGDPKTFQRIMRDREAQSKLVSYFIEKNMPPRARQILAEDKIRRTPAPTSELLAAYKEAKEKGLKQEASELKTQLWERMYSKDAGKSSRIKAGV